jgi:nucleoside-diphosphate-sugar epimerase
VIVLVTGASGFLGAATVDVARRAGLTVVPTARRGSDGVIGVDLEDVPALVATLDDVQPEAIINCAAVADFGSGVLARQYRTNALAPALMAAWAGRHNTLVVQASATMVHGLRTERIGPTTRLNPDTDYARSKWLAEEMIGASGCRSATIRFAGIFGRSGPGHLGINTAIRKAENGSSPTVVGKGRARRNYVHVEDAAAALVHCVQTQQAGVFLMGGADTLSIREMLEAVMQVYSPRGELAFTPGMEARDQIVETSPELPPGRSFLEALRDERSRGRGGVEARAAVTSAYDTNA